MAKALWTENGLISKQLQKSAASGVKQKASLKNRSIQGNVAGQQQNRKKMEELVSSSCQDPTGIGENAAAISSARIESNSGAKTIGLMRTAGSMR